jgi:hypothetical protein
MQVLWSQSIAAPLRGLALARERGWVLAWDSADGLHLWDRRGRPQAHRRAPGALTAVACAEDGGSFAAAGERGELWSLAPDLTVRWERPLGQRGGAVALDPFGRHVAVADGGGALRLFDREGKELWKVSTFRPLRHLAFVPESPAIAGSADYGLVICFDAEGKLLWRDGLVAHIGSLAVSGDGGVIALACFTEGIYCYGVERPQTKRIAQAAPCHLGAVSYDGDVFLTAGLQNQVALRDHDGAVRREWTAEGPIAGLALGPLADFAVVGLAEGRVLALTPRTSAPRPEPTV